MRRLVFLLIGLSISLAAMAHAYHASIMDVRYNAQKQQLEIALKVFTDDFEKALSQGQPKPISLLQMPATQTKPITAAYLARTLRFGTKPGETLPLTYLGMQHEGDAHWLYCTVKLPRALKSLTLHHKLLLDQFSDEMNIVNLEAGGKKQSTLFRSGEEEQTFSW
ncbi:DUF6702 family protein [Hymenobacter sp. DG25A]|uniref:DUF6702 family protein n=1 Tax=Hymenobacter sp. DG25A TaxID=1385663 RepID=UPI0006BD1ED3|nr:DUF6702 family protein [Hymenobacter sp. DG25A]ALD20279.1 hypothetical protein AM218_02320 [Hymenobacter sp. DG25A]